MEKKEKKEEEKKYVYYIASFSGLYISPELRWNGI